MGFFYGFVGAVLGSILGGVTAFFVLTAVTDGNSLGVGLGMLVFGPVGLVLGAILGVMLALRVLYYVRGNRDNGQARRKNALVVGGFVLAIPILITAMLWGVDQFGNPPSDQQLLNNFNRHRATFDKLAQMTKADKNLSRVDSDWTDPSDPQTVGVMPERIREYRRLLDSVDLHRGFQAYGKEVDFISYAQGSAISSDTDKGYAYLTVPPKQTLSSLDQCQPDEDEKAIEAYRHIEGCWYLYYDYRPD